MKRAVVLLSGGIDSTVTLASAGNTGFEVYAISFSYGQRHRVELNFAKQSAARFNVKKHLITEFNLREIGGSALTSDIEIPKNRETLIVRHEATKGRPLAPDPLRFTDIPVTYVPARNSIFLSFALALAESIEAHDIFIGVNAVDYSGYPDCRPAFITAFEHMANLATKTAVEGKGNFKIHAPLVNLSKGEIIKKGIELGVDFSSTWSCYDPQELTRDETRGTKHEGKTSGKEVSSLVPHPSSFTYVPCGSCDSCLLRAKGFKDAGMQDPLLKVKH